MILNLLYKKVFLSIFLFVSFFIFLPNSFANSGNIDDYTLIDCINGNDNDAVAFDSSKPYQSLKAGIENSTKYINENINKPGNEQTASGMTFNVKINCTTNDLSSDEIRLDFYGETYKNELILEGVGENSFVLQNIYFYIPKETGRIVFKNANFLDNSKYGYYFKPESNKGYEIHNFYGIKIIKSYINIKKDTNISSEYSYNLRSAGWGFNNYKYDFNQILVYNSIINIDIDSNYNYKNIFLIKDSKINFKNISYVIDPYTIKFIENNNFHSLFISNEIDFGGNNFSEIGSDMIYINNKFKNFKSFLPYSLSKYLNNTFENELELDISNTKYFINNIFKSSFKNDNDKNNLNKLIIHLREMNNSFSKTTNNIEKGYILEYYLNK